MSKHKVILDCDNTMGMPGWEVDDGLVLLYLLGRDDIDLLGITNVFGNGSLKDVSYYTRRQLEEIGRTDIPRYDGVAYRRQNPQLSAAIKNTERYAGEIQQDPDKITDAAQFLADTVASYPGEVTILAAGPVSNLLQAHQVNKAFYSQVKEIVCMGGYIEDLYIGGHLLEELNLSCDPKASYAMFFSGAPVAIMNGQVCLKAPFGKEEIKRAAKFWPEARIRVLQEWLERFGGALDVDVFYLWDLLLPVYVSYPELFVRNDIWINPTEKDLHRGMLMPSREGTGVRINMPMEFDVEQCMEILFSAWEREWKLESNGWVKEANP